MVARRRSARPCETASGADTNPSRARSSCAGLAYGSCARVPVPRSRGMRWAGRCRSRPRGPAAGAPRSRRALLRARRQKALSRPSDTVVKPSLTKECSLPLPLFVSDALHREPSVDLNACFGEIEPETRRHVDDRCVRILERSMFSPDPTLPRLSGLESLVEGRVRGRGRRGPRWSLRRPVDDAPVPVVTHPHACRARLVVRGGRVVHHEALSSLFHVVDRGAAVDEAGVPHEDVAPAPVNSRHSDRGPSSGDATRPRTRRTSRATRLARRRSRRERTRTREPMGPGDVFERSAVGAHVFERDPGRAQVQRRTRRHEHRIAVRALRRAVFEVQRLKCERGLVEDQVDEAEQLGVQVERPGTVGIPMKIGDAVAALAYRSVVVAERGRASGTRW